jgi:NAD(P)-dependent dehydrogenase (short-subunit alcohol dehydrogenase family)
MVVVPSKHFEVLVPSLPEMQDKVVAVTGCTSGTGLVLAKLCARKGAKVILLNRASERADAALLAVQENAATAASVMSLNCDLGDFESVRIAAKKLTDTFKESGIDVLANNAGVMAMNDVATKDGCDIQMQTNHLSHFLLTAELFPLFELAAEIRGEARIINHSSIARNYAHGRLDARYFGKNGGSLGGDSPPGFSGPALTRYAQSKLANVAFTYALHEKLLRRNSKVKALVCHPGVCATNLHGNSDQLSGGGTVAAEDGACGIITCCCMPNAQSGSFYGPIDNGGFSGKAVLMPRDRLAPESLRMLWEETESSTGCTFFL